MKKRSDDRHYEANGVDDTPSQVVDWKECFVVQYVLMVLEVAYSVAIILDFGLGPTSCIPL